MPFAAVGVGIKALVVISRARCDVKAAVGYCYVLSRLNSVAARVYCYAAAVYVNLSGGAVLDRNRVWVGAYSVARRRDVYASRVYVDDIVAGNSVICRHNVKGQAFNRQNTRCAELNRILAAQFKLRTPFPVRVMFAETFPLMTADSAYAALVPSPPSDVSP